MKPMKRTTREFLLDIDQNIERAIDFVKDLDFDQFAPVSPIAIDSRRDF